MRTSVRAALILTIGILALYFVIFLITVPVMASSSQTARMVGGNVYVTLYRPLRDALPAGYVLLELWRDYERYWCVESDGCRL